MDHLPLPPSNYQGHMHIPYTPITTQTHQWDHGSWQTFSTRTGISCEDLFASRTLSLSLTQREHRTYHATVLAQSWLFFGVVSAVLGIHIEIDEWTSMTSTSRQILSTRNLPRYVRDWKDSMQRLDESAAGELMLQKHALVEMAGTPFDMLAHANTAVPVELLLAISVLHATLNAVLNAALELEDEPIVRDLSLFYVHTRVFEERFRDHGWCPSDQALLRQNVSLLTEYYAAQMTPVHAAKEHGECSAETCVANQLDMGTYRSRHVVDGCACESMALDGYVIANNIMSGETPLINITEGEDSKCEAKIVPRTNSRHYICYSHVWSDGLGNISCNALPQCQMRYLQQKANDLARLSGLDQCTNMPFWLDTLCIPVGPEHQQARNKAIATMAQTYEDATQVLVLSREIMDLSSHTVSAELILRISRTPWFRRLWTLQEGVLAANVWFQLATHAINLHGLASAPFPPADPTNITALLHHRIHSESTFQLRTLCAFRAIPANKRASHLWRAVQWRTTSVPSDETLCLASILRLPLDTILAIDKDRHDVHAQRMRAFLLVQRYFPACTLFKSNVNRPSRADAAALDLPGCRWAPRSFVVRHLQAEAGDELGRADERGFHVRFPGVRFDWVDLRGWSDQEREGSCMRFAVVGEEGTFWETLWYDGCWAVVPDAVQRGCTPFLVLEHDVFGLTEDDDQDARGVFVTVENDAVDTADTLFARLWGTVFVTRCEIDDEQTTFWKRRSFVKKIGGMKRFEPLTPYRNWCIG